ncbi:uncharacterized protein [Coffea arabica]|uniref:Putative plant transposon protein domain-containing protein n=1 Tax=Coffea arabica TaxID=13443 RepID=A0A6P6XCM9_COFAR|nr:uncharacterized protein LOC113738731 [Coffea arabica]XP_027125024.1 uncharacterized protein LOC113741640 [Coffea arabica]
MSIERPLRVSLYWGGKIHYEDESIYYLPRTSNRTFSLRHRIGYEELVDRIYQYMGVDRGMFKLNLFLRQPCGRTSYNLSQVLDDETLEIMYDVWNEIVPYIAELYIEKEEIVQNPQVSSIFIPPTTNVGPMMSLIHACNMASTMGRKRQVVYSSSSSEEAEENLDISEEVEETEEVARSLSPAPDSRRLRGRTALQPQIFDSARFSTLQHQKWYEAHANLEFLFEKHVSTEVENAFQISEAFDQLGWAPILRLPVYYYPELVREFYANIINKAKHSGEKVESFVRGTRIVLSRQRLAAILGCRDEGPAVDLKKGFVAPNKRWDPTHAMARFGLQYQPFRSSRKETIVATVFDVRHRLIIYMIAHNVIPKKTGHSEVRKSDIYILDYMFHNRETSYAQISLPNIIISYIRSTVRRRTTSFKLAFPRLFTLVFERMGVNLAGADRQVVRPSTKLSFTLLRNMGIDLAAFIPPLMERRSKARHGGDDVGPSTSTPPPPPPVHHPQPNWRRLFTTLDDIQFQLGRIDARLARIEAHLGIPPPQSGAADENDN